MALDAEVEGSINASFVLIAGFLCFLLQAGFGLLEVGSVREKNATSIMFKNVMDAAVSALAYWAVGFAFAYGEGSNPFIGHSYFFLMDYENYINFFFQWVFAGTTATIVSGAVAERCRLRAYLVYSAFISGFIYPVVCHWIWDPDGFMYGKVADFSGSGAVHLVGGAAAMSGAYFLGPRIGKFVKDEGSGKIVAASIPGHNAVLAAVGTLILWFGFLPFNAGAGYSIASEQGAINTGRAVVVTVLAGASGGCFLLFFGVWKFKQWDLAFAMNGLLGGMVATCSGVNVYDTWIAVVVGILGATGFYVSDWLFENVLRIDDPVSASPLHMGSGMVGLISVGFFANPRYIGDDPNVAGIFYGGNGKQLGYQFYGLVAYFAWSFGLSSLMFWGLNRLGWLRVSVECELMGLDLHHHGREAYPRKSVVSFNVDDTVRDEAAGLNDETDEDVDKNAEADDNVEIDEEAQHDHKEYHDVEELPVPSKDKEAMPMIRQRRKTWAALDPGAV